MTLPDDFGITKLTLAGEEGSDDARILWERHGNTVQIVFGLTIPTPTRDASGSTVYGPLTQFEVGDEGASHVG